MRRCTALTVLSLKAFIFVGAQPIRSPVAESAIVECPFHEGILSPRGLSAHTFNVNVHGNVNVKFYESEDEINLSQNSSTREVQSLADTNIQLSNDCPSDTSCIEPNTIIAMESDVLSFASGGSSTLAPTLNRIPSKMTTANISKTTTTVPCEDCPGAAVAAGSENAAVGQ